MPAQQDNGGRKPSVIDLVTDPEKFDQWQRQRERDEASDGDGGRERSRDGGRDGGRDGDRGDPSDRGRSDNPGGRD
ncbi:hypothetical protein [Azospirillum argentinense]